MRILRTLSHFIFYHAYVRWKISRTDRVTVCGFPLMVPKTVFQPSLYLTSRYFGQFIAGLNLKEKRGLDVGSGSGVLSIAAASRGARMVALDVNPAAIDATMENARSNGFGGQIVPVCSDLFANLSPMHRNFDFILCNPPYYLGKAADVAERAWRGGPEHEFLQRLAVESAAYLRRDGSIYFILSTDIDVDRILAQFHGAGYGTTLVSRKRFLFESLLIFQAILR